MRRLLFSIATMLACMPAFADDPAANGVPGSEGEYAREAGTPTDPATGKEILAISEGAKAGAKAGGIAGTLTNQPPNPSVAVKR